MALAVQEVERAVRAGDEAVDTRADETDVLNEAHPSMPSFLARPPRKVLARAPRRPAEYSLEPLHKYRSQLGHIAVLGDIVN